MFVLLWLSASVQASGHTQSESSDARTRIDTQRKPLAKDQDVGSQASGMETRGQGDRGE